MQSGEVSQFIMDSELCMERRIVLASVFTARLARPVSCLAAIELFQVAKAEEESM